MYVCVIYIIFNKLLFKPLPPPPPPPKKKKKKKKMGRFYVRFYVVVFLFLFFCCFFFVVFFFFFFFFAFLFHHFDLYITKMCQYFFDPLKPHFHIVKLGLTGVYIIFLTLAWSGHWYTLEPLHRGGSNEYPQSMFWEEIWNVRVFIWNFSVF